MEGPFHILNYARRRLDPTVRLYTWIGDHRAGRKIF